MSNGKFRVGFMGRPMHQAFQDTAAKYLALEVVTCDITCAEDDIAKMLGGCYGYYAVGPRYNHGWGNGYPQYFGGGRIAA